MPRQLPSASPDPTLLRLFEQPDQVPLAVRRQADFFLFFARTIFPLLEQYRDRLHALYCANNGRPASDPVRLLAVLILQFVLRVPPPGCRNRAVRPTLASGVAPGINGDDV